MERHQHLRLPLFQGNVERYKQGGGGPCKLPEGRSKSGFAQQYRGVARDISGSLSSLRDKFSGKIDPSLIFEIEINQSIYPDGFEQTLAAMGINVLSVAENKKGFWVVFSDDEDLVQFRKKLATYGSDEGPKYDFFNAIKSFNDIAVEKKICERLARQPLRDSPEFIDIELWKIDDPQKNELFISQLRDNYGGNPRFRIADTLITKSFVLLRVKLSKDIFDDIIELKEIARADRPPIVQFNPFEMMRPDVNDIVFNAPADTAIGILVIDSGIVASHPMLEECVGGEENYQTGESATHDTVGHGTGVAGCAVYGDIEESLGNKEFSPDNWLFSAKVMYAETDLNGNVHAVYDENKLIEHQFKDAVEDFLTEPEYHIKVVNISLGNASEVWHKHYSRQLPLAALIDELAYTFPHVVFVVSAGNLNPLTAYDSIAEIVDNYPTYLTENPDFRIVNPATSALAFTVGSIADEKRVRAEHFGNEQIKTAIAVVHQPSPFTRTGPGINGMIKPELVEYGGNAILYENGGRILEDIGGKVALLNNNAIDDIIKFDAGTSFAAPKVANLAGQLANRFHDKSANFIKNMLLVGAEYPFAPTKNFYGVADKKKAEQKHLSVCGYGLSSYDRACYSFDNRAVLWDESYITLNQIKVYSLQLPDLFFAESGRKKIVIALTFTPETRSTRGDSYLGNRLEFHLFHGVNPQVLIEKYGVIEAGAEMAGVPADLKKYEIDFFPGSNTRKAGCHQKAWKIYQGEPKQRPNPPLSLVLLNVNKWIADEARQQDYCISVMFEHEKEIELYSAIRTNIQLQQKTRVRR